MSGDGHSFKSLKEVRLKNLNRIVVAHLNINSLRSKFDALVEQVSGNVDVLVLSETKIDESFPEGQFKIPGFCTPFRLDRDRFGRGILVYVQENIPAKLLSSEAKTIEGTFIELNFRKKKWLLSCSYNPSKSNIISHLEQLRRSLDFYSANYDNLSLMGNFNVNTSELNMKDFCNAYGFKSLIKVPTYFKKPENPSCIDLILTNNPLSFQNSGVIETGLSDFHKMIVTVMKTTNQKLNLKITYYRDYNTFCNDNFREHLLSALVMEKLDTNNGLEKFLGVCVKTLDRFAPYKKKYLGGNNMPFHEKKPVKKQIS